MQGLGPCAAMGTGGGYRGGHEMRNTNGDNGGSAMEENMRR